MKKTLKIFTILSLGVLTAAISSPDLLINFFSGGVTGAAILNVENNLPSMSIQFFLFKVILATTIFTVAASMLSKK